MSNKRKLRVPDHDELSCDVCGLSGEAEGPAVKFWFGPRTVAPSETQKLLAYAYGGHMPENIPAVVIRLLAVCDGHSDDEYLRAGVIPDNLIDGMSNLREAISTSMEMMTQRFAS